MKVNEVKIKKLINEYKISKEKNLLIEILKELSIMIYNYPKILFGRDEDDCSEFYLYFIERIENLLLNYDETKASFNTYFNIVLKSRYINWLNKISQERKKKLEPILIEDLKFQKNIAKELYEIYSPDYKYIADQSEISEKIEKILKKLKVLDYLIIKLCYFPIDSNTLQVLSNHLKIPLKNCYELYEKFYFKYGYTEKVEKALNKITSLKLKLEKLDENIKSGLKEKIEKELNEATNSYFNIKFLGIKEISQILKIPEGEVYYRLNNSKNILKNYLKEFIN